MKRKLRPWVKVSAGILAAAVLSAAASCQNETVYTLQNEFGKSSSGSVTDKHGQTEPMRFEAQESQRKGENLLLVPKLLKEVADI